MPTDAILPVKAIAAILHAPPSIPKPVVKGLENRFGPVDFLGCPHPFDVTDYYAQEMGAVLLRTIVSFSILMNPSELPRHKIMAIEIERAVMASGNCRTVNIDTGYLDYDKVVLASTKRGPYKIYITEGIWADMTLHYEKGRFAPFSWSFADFRDGRYNAELLRIRTLYKQSLFPKN